MRGDERKKEINQEMREGGSIRKVDPHFCSFSAEIWVPEVNKISEVLSY